MAKKGDEYLKQIVVSDPETGRAFNVYIRDKETEKRILGLKIGDRFDASFLGLEGYELEITGGSDKDGFPMRKDVHGGVRKKILLRKGPGYRPKEKGVVRRKYVRGNVVTEDIVQVNTKIVKKGSIPVEEIIKKFKEQEEQKK